METCRSQSIRSRTRTAPSQHELKLTLNVTAMTLFLRHTIDYFNCAVILMSKHERISDVAISAVSYILSYVLRQYHIVQGGAL
jgi:hypothetical protein